MDRDTFLSSVYNQFLRDNNLKDFATLEEENLRLDYPDPETQPSSPIPIVIDLHKRQINTSDIQVPIFKIAYYFRSASQNHCLRRKGSIR
jgi:hypothetical protein